MGLMIPKDTIDKIFDAARIEEVVGDFVTLKKRGANLLGLCPFHNEKTPSFTVSPAKGIYKCFGCGKAGNSVNFMMDHDQMTYPEALRYLARKYNIEVEEKEQTPEQLQSQNERESLFVVCTHAQKYFTNNLFNSDEGRSVGLSYFKERGFRDEIIEKFQLGYALEERKAFTKDALGKGYKLDYLVKAGLTINKDEETSNLKPETSNYFDRFAGRVIFPIHNVTGRPIAFGGRILKTDKKLAKYINSPETDIYHKSNVLYGLFFAKKTIIADDNCFLAEGYTDVISLYQAGIENVVSSSGTSLTVEQIRQIKRFTQNITILYDGDSAGIKASFRGIDLILEEGINVKVLLFPDGDDPDSFSKKVGQEELKTFIRNNTQSFVEYKTSLLMQEAGGDPFKKTAAIRDVANTLALLSALDAGELITKFVQNRIVNIDEQTFHNEVNKFRRTRLSKSRETRIKEAEIETKNDSENNSNESSLNSNTDLIIDINDRGAQEKDIITLLLKHGDKTTIIEEIDEEGKPVENTVTVAELVLHELTQDSIVFENQVYQYIYSRYKESLANGQLPDLNSFINKDNIEISKVVIDLISSQYTLAKWDQHNIFVQTEEQKLKETIYKYINALKAKYIQRMIDENLRLLKDAVNDEDVIVFQQKQKQLDEAKSYFNNLLGRIIVK